MGRLAQTLGVSICDLVHSSLESGSMIDFLDWLARASGIVAVLLAAIGYMFREKWKQILQRSLSEDLERLKADLQRSAAEHAASLAPQLEQVKHDFQQKLEAYKVGLIAQAEAAKSESQLRKRIAMRYAEVEFERLVALELDLAAISSEIIPLGGINVQGKTRGQFDLAVSKISQFTTLTTQAGMFLTLEDQEILLSLRTELVNYTGNHVGENKPAPPDLNASMRLISSLAVRCHSSIRSRIKSLGTLSFEGG